MRAAVYRETGEARKVLKLEQRRLPDPGEAELRVRVHASGVNPSDTKRRMGIIPQSFEIVEVVPHTDAAGLVDAVGSGVDEKWIGSRVWVHSAQVISPAGAAAEYVVVDAKNIGILPDSVSFEEGATVGVPLLTAWYAIDLADDLDGKTVLVTGGAGAVGHFAIQLAKLKGARVLTTVSGPEKAQHAKSAGADEIINYREEDVAARVGELTGGRGVDHYVEVDFHGNAGALPDLISVDATVVVYGTNRPDATIPNVFAHAYKRTRLFFFVVYFLPDDVIERGKTELLALMNADKLVYPIAGTFPLEDIALAHEEVEAGAIGNVVVVNT